MSILAQAARLELEPPQRAAPMPRALSGRSLGRLRRAFCLGRLAFFRRRLLLCLRFSARRFLLLARRFLFRRLRLGCRARRFLWFCFFVAYFRRFTRFSALPKESSFVRGRFAFRAGFGDSSGFLLPALAFWLWRRRRFFFRVSFWRRRFARRWRGRHVRFDRFGTLRFFLFRVLRTEKRGDNRASREGS